jgi:hypothetical protein
VPATLGKLATAHSGEAAVSAMLKTARKFFEACETGKGWDGCKGYCTADAKQTGWI